MSKIKEEGMYVIYTRWLATALRNAGFSIEKVEANPHKPEFDCYLFKNSSEFQKCLTEISNKN